MNNNNEQMTSHLGTRLNYKKQQGWTFWSMLFTMSVLGFLAYVTMQLVPLYAGNESIRNAVKLSLDGQNLQTMTRSQVLKKLQAQLYLDGNHQILNYKKDVKVKRSRKEFIVDVIYSREVPLFFNLSLKANFNNHVVSKLK